MRGEGYSLADIAAATGNNNGSGMFGDNWAWIIILIILFGYGRNGFGGNNSGVNDNYVLTSDFATLERKLDSITNGLCDGFYTQAQLVNGVNTNILTSSNAIQSQLASCCCDIREAIGGVNFNLSQGFCGVNNTINIGVRDIIDNQNANYRALHDEIIANRIEDKNAQITAQQNEINALRLSASQAKQNEYLLNSLRNGCPVNAQLVCGNQPIPVQYVTASCGCNNNF